MPLHIVDCECCGKQGGANNHNLEFGWICDACEIIIDITGDILTDEYLAMPLQKWHDDEQSRKVWRNG